MSTKTLFKRVALVSVASLGIGLISAIPSNAQILSASVTTSATNSTTVGADTTGKSDSTTGGTFTVSFQASATTDSVVITSIAKSKPAAASSVPVLNLTATDTSSSTTEARVWPVSIASGTYTKFFTGGTVESSATQIVQVSGAGTASVTFKAWMESSTTRYAGVYTYTMQVAVYSNGALVDGSTKVQDISLTVAAAPTYGAAVAGNSSATLSTGTSYSSATNVDSVVSALATADVNTARATVRVVLKDILGAATEESVTVSIDKGNIGTSGPIGKNVTLRYLASTGYLDFYIYADGTAGTATLTIKSTSVTFANKTITFYSSSVATINATLRQSVLAVGSNSNVVSGVAKDSNGTVSAASTAVYAYSSNTSVVSDSGTACTWNASLNRHDCTLTGVAAGTANITLKNTATGTAAVGATVLSTEVITVTVNSNVPNKLVLAFDKATYAPGEKAYIKVSAVDAAGNPVAGTIGNLITSTGISYSPTFSGTIPTMTNTSYTLAKTEVAVNGTLDSLNPISVITVFMPYSGGTVTIAATGGSSLPVANQSLVTATASVSDNAATALAAVTALASQVSAFITKINAQITTLTDLVMKIQKKVKA